jgi:hypothetical protein
MPNNDKITIVIGGKAATFSNEEAHKFVDDYNRSPALKNGIMPESQLLGQVASQLGIAIGMEV